jgi:MFS family permease
LLRFVDGIFLGGGYTGAIPLAFEYSKKHQRGLVGGLIMAGFPAAYVCINLVTMAVFALFPLHGAASPYAQWGWRIPFVVGALLAVALAVYYVFKVEESEIWKSGARAAARAEKQNTSERVPLTDLLRGKSGANLRQVLLMMTGFWLTQNLITLFLPGGILVKAQHLTGFKMSLTLLIAYSVLIASYIGFGMLGQKIGRRKLFLILSPLIATVGSALLYVLANVQGLSFATVVTLVCLLTFLATAPWGFIITYVNERFVTDVRATGFGVGFSLSVIVPSFYAFYMKWLDTVMPLGVAPSVLLSIGGVIALIGAYLGPETKDVDF